MRRLLAQFCKNEHGGSFSEHTLLAFGTAVFIVTVVFGLVNRTNSCPEVPNFNSVKPALTSPQ
jgi:Flp pilus assembly pilin Flp